MSLQNRTGHWWSVEFLGSFSFHPKKASKIRQMNSVLFVYSYAYGVNTCRFYAVGRNNLVLCARIINTL